MPGLSADDAWPRVEALIEALASRHELDAVQTAAALAKVRGALWRLQPFVSQRAADRLADVVFIRFVRAEQRREARRSAEPQIEFVPLPDPYDEDHPDDAAQIAADPADSPEDRAVMRAHFDAVLFSLTPPPSQVEVEALMHTARPPRATRREQLLWGVRASRIRQRVRDAVDSIDELLMPVVAAIRLRRPRGSALLGGAAAGTVACLSVSTLVGNWAAAGPDTTARAVARAAAKEPPSPGWLPSPGAAAFSSTSDGQVTSKAAQEREDGGRRPVPPLAASAEVRRDDNAATARSSVTVEVDYRTSNTLTIEVYCDSEIRKAACSAVPAGATRIGSP